jgi:hypothetical protein
MKTLVIHPEDSTTDFLKVIYVGKNWTEIHNDVSKKELITKIMEHDRIIMLGHGEGIGLYGHDRMIINSEFVYLLREKICVCIWCNADIFVKKYGLNGFYTGMIISDSIEANLFCVNGTNDDLEYSNILFADAVSKSIEYPDALDLMKIHYDGENPFIDFNKQNVFYE